MPKCKLFNKEGEYFILFVEEEAVETYKGLYEAVGNHLAELEVVPHSCVNPQYSYDVVKVSVRHDVGTTYIDVAARPPPPEFVRHNYTEQSEASDCNVASNAESSIVGDALSANVMEKQIVDALCTNIGSSSHFKKKTSQGEIHDFKQVLVTNVSPPYYESVFQKFLTKAMMQAGVVDDLEIVVVKCSVYNEVERSVVVEFSTRQVALSALALEGIEFLFESLHFSLIQPAASPKEDSKVKISNVTPPYSEAYFKEFINKAMVRTGLVSEPQNSIKRCYAYDDEEQSVVVEFLTPGLARSALDLEGTEYMFEKLHFSLKAPSVLDSDGYDILEEAAGCEFSPLHLEDDNEDFNSPPRKLSRLLPRQNRQWSDDATSALLNALIEYNKTFHIDMWSGADWIAACRKVIETYGFSAEQCKTKRKRMSDYLWKCEKEGNLGWPFADQVAKIRCSGKNVRKKLAMNKLSDSTVGEIRSPPTKDASPTNEEPELDKGKKWSVSETQLMISSWGTHRELRKLNVPERDVWKNVVEDLANDKNHHVRTVKECVRRLSVVMAEYKAQVDNAKKSGFGAKKATPYYDQLDQILGTSVTIRPRYTVAVGSSNVVSLEDGQRSSKGPAVHRKTRAELQEERAREKVQAQLDNAAALSWPRHLGTESNPLKK